MIRKLNKKDRINFLDYCSQFGNNLFIDCSFKNLELEFNNLLNKLCFIDEEHGEFRGLLFIKKIDNKNYLKVTYKKPIILDRLLNVLFWNLKEDVIIKLNDYKVVSTLKRHYFRFNGKENLDYIYVRKYYTRTKNNGSV